MTKAVIFVKPNALHCTGLSDGEDHGLAGKLSLGLLELGGLKWVPLVTGDRVGDRIRVDLPKDSTWQIDVRRLLRHENRAASNSNVLQRLDLLIAYHKARRARLRKPD